MKIMILFFLVLARSSFADSLVLENQTSHPNTDQKSKIAVQWASSAKEVNEGNQALIYGSKLNQKSLQFLKKTGTLTVNIPKKAEYFRVVVWSNGEGEPDLVTNWVDIVPDKTYTLQSDHLVPSVLMLGTGC
jgi:hypothetical protein